MVQQVLKVGKGSIIVFAIFCLHFSAVCLFTNLNACLTQSKAFAQFFSHKSIRVMSFIKESLQFIQLFQSEICTAPSIFLKG